jgi:8-oxo-dGTP pyrophosphatase MutT (NUDIX family)
MMLEAALAHPFLRALAETLRTREPVRAADDDRASRAAVALVHRLGAAGEVELLLVKRATYEGDPWSGHIALPGGRSEPGDPSLADTAVRETREETAIDLHASGRILGALDEMHPRNPLLPQVIISPFVAVVGGRPEPRLSPEIAEAFWVPLAALRDPGTRRDVELVVAGAARTVQSIQHGGHTVWGVTHRILEHYLEVAGRAAG